MLRLALISVFVLTSNLLVPTFHAGAQRECDQRHDLAGLAISTLDDGLEEFVHLGAFDESLTAESGIMASYLGFTRTPVEMRDFLDEQGWQRKYVIRSGQPVADLSSRYAQIVHSYITEYCNAEGAAAAFPVLEDESASQGAEDGELTRSFGEDSDLTLDEGIDSDNRQFSSLDLSFRVENLIAGVTIIAYPTSEGSDPDQDFAESLAAILEHRLFDPPPSGPGVSLARLDPGEVVTFDDAYYRMGGIDVPMAGESADAAESRTASYAGSTDVYQVFQDVQGESITILYSLTVYQFPTDADAESWLDQSSDLIEANSYYGNVEEVQLVALPIETTRALQFEPFGGPNTAVIVLAGDGNLVHRVQLVPSGPVSGDTVDVAESLMLDQLECSRSGECDSVPIPDALTKLTALPVATPLATPESG